MIHEFLKHLKEKYNYNENLLHAINLAITLMQNKFGEENIQEILNVFDNVKIFTTNDFSKENIKKIESDMTNGINEDVKSNEQNDVYLTNKVGSLYSYQAVYDEIMYVQDEIKWIIVEDMGLNHVGYEKLFNTSINFPYFLHEVNHAYAMQNPKYLTVGDKIEAKHGMISANETVEVDQFSGYVVSEEINKDVICEEIINEKITQDMLMDYFKVNSYEEVNTMLSSINHLESNYNSVLITIAKKFEQELGFDNLMRLRKDNDMSVISKFNELARQSKIASEYLDGESPYDYFIEKIYELYNLSLNKYQMEVDEYNYQTSMIMVDAYIPLCAHQESNSHDMDLEKYNEIRNRILMKYENKSLK